MTHIKKRRRFFCDAIVLHIYFDHTVISTAHERFNHFSLNLMPEECAPGLLIAALCAAAEHGALNRICHRTCTFVLTQRNADPIRIFRDFIRYMLFQELYII